jgi:hypothetical protein
MNTHNTPLFFLEVFILCEVHSVLGQVRLDLLHQHRHGNERAAQRLGLQQVLQLFRLCRVNARVLRRVGVLLLHCFHPVAQRSAPTDFYFQRLFPCEGVAGVFHVVGHGVDFAAHDAQLRVRGSRRHVDGNHNILDCFIALVGRVSGGTVSGTGL